MPRKDIRNETDYQSALELFAAAKQKIDPLASKYSRNSVKLLRQVLYEAGVIEQPPQTPRRSSSYAPYPVVLHPDRPVLAIAYGNFVYNSQTLTVSHRYDGEKILTPKEDALMYAFVTHPRIPLSVERLITEAHLKPEATRTGIIVAIHDLRLKADEGVDAESLLKVEKKRNRTRWKYFPYLRNTGSYMFLPDGVTY